MSKLEFHHTVMRQLTELVPYFAGTRLPAELLDGMNVHDVITGTNLVVAMHVHDPKDKSVKLSCIGAASTEVIVLPHGSYVVIDTFRTRRQLHSLAAQLFSGANESSNLEAIDFENLFNAAKVVAAGRINVCP